MKKNITINLFGALYAIDEDAYELLKQYQDNMRRYFSRKEGGEEIADDIEHRVAELLAELKASGVAAITIEHVEEIIGRIGNPEQMDDEQEEEKTETVHEKTADGLGKRLYRDPDDVVLGGVMSGIAHYFGTADPVWWRLAMVLLGIFSTGLALVGYIVLWLVMPVAQTPEDRLRMHGQPVNTQTLNEEMMRSVNKARETIASPENRRRAGGSLGQGLRIFVKVVAVLFLAWLCFLFLSILVPLIAVIFGVTLGTAEWSYMMADEEVLQVWQNLPGLTWQVCAIAIAGLLIVGLPAFVLIRRLVSPRRSASSLAYRITLIIAWVLSIALAIGLSVNLAIRYELAEEKATAEKYTRGGVRLTRESWNYIDRGHWEVKQLKGCGTHVVDWENDLVTGNSRQYFNFNASSHGRDNMEIDLCRSVEAEPGEYRLEGLGLADAAGANIYFMQNDTTKIVGEIPVTYQRSANNLRDIPWSKARTISLFEAVTDSAAWDSIARSPRLQNYIESKPFRHNGGRLTYGFHLLSGYTFQPWMGTRVVMIDLRPVRLGD